MIGVIVVVATAAVDAFTAGIFVGHKMGSNSVQTAALNILAKAQAVPLVAKATADAKVLATKAANEAQALVAKVETAAPAVVDDVEALKAKLEALTAQAKATL